MPIDDLFDEEDAMISMATDIVATNSYSENPLFPHFSKLLLSFVKLNKQQKRIIRLSDKQHLKISVVNREMKHILDKAGTINPSYSRYMHQLFKDTKKNTGANTDHLLYWEENREKEQETAHNFELEIFSCVVNQENNT